MTRLAAWIMVSPLRAFLATLMLGLSGVFSWAAPVPAVLVTLRFGLARAVLPLVGLIGIVALHVQQGELTLVGSVLASLGAAIVLGGLSSLRIALLAVAVAAIAYALVLSSFAGEQVNNLLDQYRQAMDLLVQTDETTAPALSAELMIQLIGIWVCVSAAANLFIARSMQARLFNPGGFRQEFHGLRLTPAQNALCLLPLLAAEFAPQAEVVAGIGLVPVLMAGLGLLHGVAGRRQWGVGPLVVAYLGLFLLPPVVTPVLLMAALADSFFDFRQKLA